ncbi:MAG: sulfite exporter TauE/SafE family protein [Bacteroidetes bacterium]|nr:sulfite exporter TauE/SafE family protein [Bacteroidota bacterium]
MKTYLILLGLGCAAGIISGLIGIGGGVILIPSLIFILGYSQHTAEGTTLAAMIPPIGLLAAWVYYRQGHVDMKAAGLIALGFFVGGYYGAKLANQFSSETLQKIFGIILMILGLKMLWPR